MADAAIMHDEIRDGANYTVDEIARLTKCSASTVRRAISKNKLRARRNGERLLIIRGSDANAWIDNFPSIGSDDSADAIAPSGMKAKSAEDTAFLSLIRDRK